VKKTHQIFFWVIKLRMTWAGNVARMGDRRGAYMVLVGKPKGRTSRHRWEDNIKQQDMGART